MSRRESIEARLTESFAPHFLEVVDESHMHSVPKGAETHFRVTIASAAFAEQSRVQRHRAVHKALESELASGLHALTIAPFTPEEWAAGPEPLRSPQCLGGSKKAGA